MRNMKKWLAGVLTLALVISGTGAFSFDSEAKVKKPKTPKITSTTGIWTSDYNGVKFVWRKQLKAKGYEIRYNLFWKGSGKPSVLKTKTTKKRAVKFTFQDHNGIYLQIRAYKFRKVDGKKQKYYGKWRTVKLKESKVEDLIEDAFRAQVTSMWIDTVSGKATMDMGPNADSKDRTAYTATVAITNIIDTQSSGAVTADTQSSGEVTTGQVVKTHTVWTLNGNFAKETGIFTYTDGTGVTMQYDASDTVIGVDVGTEALSGTMTYDSESDKITWNNSTGITKLDSDMLFEKQILDY